MHQAEQLRRMGHHVDVFVIHGRRSKLNYFVSAFRVFSRTIRKRYDVVHAHYGLSGLAALLRFKVPLVVTLHGSDALVGRVQPLISRTVCRLAGEVIAVSRDIAARFPGVVIPCGVDLDRFQPRGRSDARKRLGLPMERRLVLFPYDPARKVKRFDLARAACDLLADLDVELLTVHGIDNEEMCWYYSASDVMLLCSRSEGIADLCQGGAGLQYSGCGDECRGRRGDDWGHRRVCARAGRSCVPGRGAAVGVGALHGGTLRRAVPDATLRSMYDGNRGFGRVQSRDEEW